MRVEYVSSAEPAAVALALREAMGDAPDGRVAIVAGLEEGEPVFVFRARDAQCFAMLADYQVVTHRIFSPERYASLVRTLDDFRAWQESHKELVRDPD